MAWKQDLAKLKQQLQPEAPVQKPQAKPAPKPTGQAPMEDEDALFLSAMGMKQAPSRARKVATPQEPPPPSPGAPVPAPETFQEAIKDLKGLKPMGKGLSSLPVQPPPSRPPAPAEDRPPETPAAETPQPPAPAPSAPSPGPQRFQLAAGMAIDVDGTLDLRGHSLSDAMERLKDRLGDGSALGWRSLQVTLGPDPILHEGLLALLASGEVPMVARYAQAPIPMGGSQAWLLYFAPPSPQA